MTDVNCPLCKNNQTEYALSVGNFEIRMCSTCDLNFVHPYQQKEEERNPLSVEKQANGEQKTIDGYFGYISKYFVDAKSYLDIGCGCGTLLSKAKDFNIPLINGVEGDKKRAEYATKLAECDIYDLDFFNIDTKNSYDLISLINVFSHIPDLDSFFKKIETLLNENGKLIIKTGLFKRGFRKNNLFDWQIPEHIHFIGDGTMAYIAKKYNFHCVEDIQVPLANELVSKSFLLSPGLSTFRNTLKKIVYYTQFSKFVLQKLYTWYTKNKLYSNIIVLQKK